MQIKDQAREDDGNHEELVLTMMASADEVDEYAKKFFDEISECDIPGFRKGKAPRSVLEQNVGGHDAAMGGIAEMLINELAFETIDKEGILFINEPEFNVENTVEEGKPFTFAVSGEVAPIMHLTNYDPVSIEMPPEAASDAEVEQQLRDLQEYYHSFEEIKDPDHAAEDGDYMMVVMTIDNHGKVMPGLRNTSRLIGLGAGTMPTSFDEKMIGAKVGETRDFDFEAKDEEGSSSFGDGDLHAVVEIKSFRRRILPEIDDELAVKVGCTDVEDMRKQMRMSVNMQKDKDLPKLMVERATDALIKRLDGEVPAYYVDFIRQDVGREFMENLDKQGVSLQQWLLENNAKDSQMKDDIANEAQRRAEIDCALEALYSELGLEITDEDIDKMFEEKADDGVTRKEWEAANRMASIYKMCRQSKATEWLVDTADVTVVDGAETQRPEEGEE